MPRACMRPGCDLTAAARLTFDPVSCQAWLDAMVDRPGPAQEVCELHADRLTLPRGWMLCDRRADEPALFVEVPGAPSSDPGGVPPGGRTGEPQRNRRKRPASPTRPLRGPAPAELFDAPPATATPAPAPAPAATVPAPVTPAAAAASAGTAPAAPPDVAEEPPELSASSPLLDRAFRATGPQHSVLTEGARPVRRRALERRLDDT